MGQNSLSGEGFIPRKYSINLIKWSKYFETSLNKDLYAFLGLN